jgi:hypothetical protein
MQVYILSATPCLKDTCAKYPRMAATEVVKLENFDTPLHGHRTLFFYDPRSTAGLPGLFDIILHGEAYSRRILLTAPASPSSSLFRAEWDAVFQPADQKEWSLILTYALYAPKHICIVIDDGLAVPDIFLQKLPAGSTVIAVRSLDHATEAPLARYDTVCFPPVADTTSMEAAAILKIVSALTRTADTETKRAWLRELRVAKAALIWTRVGEPTATGASYWYDPTDGPAPADTRKLPPHLIAAHMRALAAQLTPA